MHNRELRALVCEKVMGWTVSRDTWEWRTQTPTGSLVIWDGLGDAPAFDPVGDIGTAWEVVQKLRESRPVLRIVGIMGRPDAGDFEGVGGYRVSFGDTRWLSANDDEDLSQPYYVAEAVADSLPLAICRAALKAVGVDLAADQP